jgi:hypothetical protein
VTRTGRVLGKGENDLLTVCKVNWKSVRLEAERPVRKLMESSSLRTNEALPQGPVATSWLCVPREKFRTNLLPIPPEAASIPRSV